MPCPVCHLHEGLLREQEGGVSFLDCARCGQVSFWASIELLEKALKGIAEDGNHEIRRANLSSYLQANSKKRALDLNDIARWPLNQSLPSPFEIRDTLVSMIGDQTVNPAASTKFGIEELCARLRMPIDLHGNARAFDWYVFSDPFSEVISYDSATSEQVKLSLKSKGWARYYEIKSESPTSRTVFMAMQYGDNDLNDVVNKYFRPAVLAAGFELRVLTDKQPAGSIDDQLRVALRTSRAVIADLSHGNRGAYWEAGFAEGLGRPVIYSCKKSVWESEHQPHFDTNHLATIIWEETKLPEAAENLTNMLRATLPHEARMD